MKIFDLHCDTMTELYDRGETLRSNTCHIKEEYYSDFEDYCQVAAVISSPDLDNGACYKRFFQVVNKAEAEGVRFCKSFSDLEKGKPSFILSVEDARLLDGDISRLQSLYDRGVRIVTPLWGGSTCIGGSFDTEEGLTSFGIEVVKECLRLGIIPDISHASVKSAHMILEIGEDAGKAIIASHSNSYSVYPHPRNLSDGKALRVKETGGVIGISLYPPHLGEGEATSETVFRHIDYYTSLLGEDTLCLGADFDGIDTTPTDIKCQKELYNLENTLVNHGYTMEQITKLFYKNAFNFIKRTLNKKDT